MSNYWEVPAHDFIKEELTNYSHDIGKDITDTINYLASLLPTAYEEDFKNYSMAVKAWIAYQMETNSTLAYHKSDFLGEFIYDGLMYKYHPVHQHLKYLPNCTKPIVLPYGLTKCYQMFKDCILPDGFTIGDNFDTSSITSMNEMFKECKIPEGFSLGSKFNTSNVENMTRMFFKCELPEGFTLGDKFDTSNVTMYNAMFAECKLPMYFTLDNKFSISAVSKTLGMFAGCTIGGKPLTGTPEEIVQKLRG